MNFNIFDIDETANDGMNGVLSENKTNYISKDLLNDEKSNDDRDFNDFGEREFFSEHEYDDKYNETDGECDVAVKSVKSSKVFLFIVLYIIMFLFVTFHSILFFLIFLG